MTRITRHELKQYLCDEKRKRKTIMKLRSSQGYLSPPGRKSSKVKRRGGSETKKGQGSTPSVRKKRNRSVESVSSYLDGRRRETVVGDPRDRGLRERRLRQRLRHPPQLLGVRLGKLVFELLDGVRLLDCDGYDPRRRGRQGHGVRRVAAAAARRRRSPRPVLSPLGRDERVELLARLRVMDLDLEQANNLYYPRL